MLKTPIRNLYFQTQKIFTLIFLAMFWLQKVSCTILRLNLSKRVWTLGVIEIAGLLSVLSKIIPNSFSYNFGKQFFGYSQYGWHFTHKGSESLNFFVSLFLRPFLFAKSIFRSESFLYLGSEGFLYSGIDQRKFEFKILKWQDKKIVNILTGSDIRSLKLMTMGQGQDLTENIASCISMLYPHLLDDDYDNKIKQRCQVINTYCDFVFSAPNDQKSYLANEIFFPYLIPDSQFSRNDSKFKDLSTIRIVHAPSSPLIKGTLVIRSVIKRLKDEGFQIEYIECSDVANSTVLDLLSDAHIAINELYAFLPGVFGLEALSKFCVLVTRANSSLEPGLGIEADEAWVSCESIDLYEKMRTLLMCTSGLSSIAERGYLWAIENASEKIAGKRFINLINS